MKKNKLGILLILGLLIGAFYLFDGGRYLTLTFYQQSYADSPLGSGVLFFVIYLLVTGLSIPGATVLTLVGAAIFGFWPALVMISFASTLGATLASGLSRTLLRDWVQSRFGGYLGAIDRGMARDGALYLFSLRLIPVIPFFIINLVMGLTRMRLVTFYWVSQLGMLPGTLVYVNAGAQIGALEEISVQGILTPGILGAFVLLGLFPLLAQKLLNGVRRYRVYRGWNKPRHFDNNLLVIGAGAGGLVSAYIGAAVKAKVTLIEKGAMGGDCLNTGCVPSKALIRSSRINHYFTRAAEFGLKGQGDADFAAVMARVQQVIARVAPHDSVERYQELGVHCIQGAAKLVSPWEVEVNGQRISARTLILATGGRPRVPAIEGLDAVDYYTSDTIWALRQKPERLLVLGGGPIGCELAQAFARLGIAVTLVLRGTRLLPKEDPEVAELVAERFKAEGIELALGHQVQRCRREDDAQWLEVEVGGQIKRLPFDALLLAYGRQANTDGLGLETLGLETDAQGVLAVDEYLQTRYPNILACGDLVGPYQFTHAAAHQAWYAVVNGLFGGLKRFAVDYRVMPRATFIDPELARVGLNETDAKARGIAYEVTRYELDDLDRMLTDGEAQGFIKVLTVPGKDRILGATIVGYHAGDLIAEFVLAMRHNLGLNKVLGTIHIYPTLMEANKYLAGNWKRAHSPAWALRLLARWLRRQRGGQPTEGVDHG